MYKLINVADGSTIGRTENIEYIKQNPETKCYIKAKSYKDAQGIAFNSTAYNLFHIIPVLDEDLITVKIIEVDAGNDIDSTKAALTEANIAIDNIIISMLLNQE